MKDIKIQKDEKALHDFRDLQTGRAEIIQHGSKKPLKKMNEINSLVSTLHPSKMIVKITKIVEESEDIKSFYFKRIDEESFPNYEAGSYITLVIEKEGRTYQRPYSLSLPSSYDKEWRITIKKIQGGIISTYFHEEMKEDDEFTILGPFGNFYYQPLRDQKNIVFLAGGSGITPIYSMILDCFQKKLETITLIYGAKTVNDLIWKKEFDEFTTKHSNFHVVYVLSEEKREGYENGFIDEELLLKENIKGQSLFLCGPNKMYEMLNETLKKLDIPNALIHYEEYRSIPEGLKPIKYNLTVKMPKETKTIPCYQNKTILQAFEENHIVAAVHCTVGVCGFCKSKLIKGEIKTETSFLRKKDFDNKYIHPCVSYPLSDIEIEIPYTSR